MSKFPVSRVSIPSCLKGVENGRLPANLLHRCGVGNATMVLPAARAMRALAHAAREAGFELTHVGAYRPYDRQVALFNQRYTTTPLPGRPTKVWEGVTYWQKPKTAMAATPGTSNHGWGLAIDLAEKKNGKTVSITGTCVAWLLANADKYGYSWEAQSEPWHVRYVAGDKIPRAVKQFEEAGLQ